MDLRYIPILSALCTLAAALITLLAAILRLIEKSPQKFDSKDDFKKKSIVFPHLWECQPFPEKV